jgi:hypothetical protein
MRVHRVPLRATRFLCTYLNIFGSVFCQSCQISAPTNQVLHSCKRLPQSSQSKRSAPDSNERTAKCVQVVLRFMRRFRFSVQAVNNQGMDTLTEINWKEALALAVRLLPSRLGASVNWPAETEAVVTIAFEPEDQHCACEVRRIEVRYFESLREHGWPEELEPVYGVGAPAHHKISWPIVSVRGDYFESERLLFIDKTSTDDLAKQLRALAFAELMTPNN